METTAIATRVLRHARNALMGGSVVVNACTRNVEGTLNIRLRTSSGKADAACEEDDAARLVRALGLVEQELRRHMPLVRCFVQRSAVDGLDEVDVSVPGRREAWRRACADGAQSTGPRLLRMLAALLVASATALVARPFVL